MIESWTTSTGAVEAEETGDVWVGPYRLEPLLEVRQDDLSSLLGPKPGVYICNYPEEAWHEHFGFPQQLSYSAGKKSRMFSQMVPGSIWISPTSAVPAGKRTHAWRHGPVLHLGYRGRIRRLAQCGQTLALLWQLVRLRRRYSYCLVYNFSLPMYLAPLAASLLLRRPLYIDYEDDYTLQRQSRLKNFLERMLRRTVAGAICVHEAMASYFPRRPIRVVNSFADLRYTFRSDFTLRDGMTFLFSGRLDEIRGIDLVPDLVQALRAYIKQFTVLITGDGPLRGRVEDWDLPEVRYLGFLNAEAYAELMRRVDACLVLQKPDHPFSRGSFPSKIEEYARHEKPIFVLRLPPCRISG